MLDTLTVYTAAERIAAYLSTNPNDACPVVACRQKQTALEGGGYADTLILTVPTSHPDASFITEGAFIGFTDPDGYFQLYHIVEPVRLDAATSTLIATCEHSYYELLGEPITDIRPTDTSAEAAITQALAGTRWELGVSDDLGANSVRIYYTSVLAGLNAIAAQWGGELRFRLHVTGGVIDHRYVDILARRGADTGKRFETGKDLISVRQTVNVQGLYTALIGRGKGEAIPGDDPNNQAYGRRISFEDVVWSAANGDPCDKPVGQEWVGDEAAKAAFGTAGGTRHIFGFVNFDDETDPATLLRRTYEELQIRKEPKVTYEMSVIQLAGLTGYDHEAVRLGDDVYCINASVSPAITGKARVIDIDRNLLDLSDAQVVLGNYVPTAADSTIALKLAQQSIQDRAGVYDRAAAITQAPIGGGYLAYSIDLLITQLFSTVSGFHTDENGNSVWETADKRKAIKIGGGILAVANTKTGEEYDWTTFVTGDGVVANGVEAATGTFTYLRVGDLTGAYMEIERGEANEYSLKAYDNGGNLVVSLTKFGLGFGSSNIVHYTTDGTRTGIGIFAV